MCGLILLQSFYKVCAKGDSNASFDGAISNGTNV